jgi:hypothetical protein
MLFLSLLGLAVANHLPMPQCPYTEGSEEWVGIGEPCGQKGRMYFGCMGGYCGEDMTCQPLKGLDEPCEGLGLHEWCAGEDMAGPHFCKNSISAGGFACTKKLADGQGCITDVECSSMLCDTNQICAKRMSKGVDELCGHPDECKSGLMCATSTKLQGGNIVTRCLKPANNGEDCATDADMACASGYCAGTVCSAKLMDDEVCTRPEMCESGFCFSLDPENLPMRCTPKLEDFQPCTELTALGCESRHCVQVPGMCKTLMLNDMCNVTWGARGGCDKGLSCFMKTGMDYACVAPATEGEACGMGVAPCEDGYYCSENECMMGKSAGEICTVNGIRNNMQCASMYCGEDGTCADRKKAGTDCTYGMGGDDFCAMGTYCPDMPEAKCMKQLAYGEVCDYDKYMGMDCGMGLYCDSMGSGRCMKVVEDEEPCFTHAACGWDMACGMLTPPVLPDSHLLP